MATTIAEAIRDLDPALVLVGLAGLRLDRGGSGGRAARRRGGVRGSPLRAGRVAPLAAAGRARCSEPADAAAQAVAIAAGRAVVTATDGSRLARPGRHDLHPRRQPRRGRDRAGGRRAALERAGIADRGPIALTADRSERPATAAADRRAVRRRGGPDRRLGTGLDPRLARACGRHRGGDRGRPSRTCPAIGRPVPAHAIGPRPVRPARRSRSRTSEPRSSGARCGERRDAVAGAARPSRHAASRSRSRSATAAPTDRTSRTSPSCTACARPTSSSSTPRPSTASLFLGFAPGFGVPRRAAGRSWPAPRRATPRERVPAGSVAIAGEHTGVYPRSMPGGWHLIGRTDAVLFDPDATRRRCSGPARPSGSCPCRR